jgi:hypothetical protein
VCNKLKAEDSAAAIRKHNEDSCTIYKLSSDELKHIFGYIGEGQYAFVACTYIDSLQWGEDFGCELKQMLGQHTIAALKGHLEVVQYLITLGIDNTCANAAKNSHLELLTLNC